MRQIFIDQPLSISQIIVLDEKNTHHLKDVLRKKSGDEIRVVDSSHRAFLARLNAQEKFSAQIICEVEKSGASRKIIYCAAMIKKDKWEILLQKAAELGATRIVPLISNRTIIHLEEKEIEKKLQRWNAITLQAAQQCNRTDFCIVEKPVRIAQLSSYMSEINLLAYEKQKNNYLTNFLDGCSDITFVCGPEGGFDEKEAQQMMDMGFVCVGLGKRILRAETAGLYVLSVIDAKGEEYEVCDL